MEVCKLSLASGVVNRFSLTSPTAETVVTIIRLGRGTILLKITLLLKNSRGPETFLGYPLHQPLLLRVQPLPYLLRNNLEHLQQTR